MGVLSATPPEPRRQPRQSRSKMLVQAVREAGRAILEEEGASALTTNSIAERAGVGIASVYRYYPNKQAILADVFDEKLRTIDDFYRQKIRERELGSLPLRDEIRHLIETPIQLSLQLIHLHREFYQHHYNNFEISYRSAPDGEQNWVEWGEEWWQAVLTRRREELRVPDPKLSARIMLMAVRGAIDAAVEREPSLLEQPEFVEGLVDLACRYLL
jgi:AcrR family transcriptional regulator